MPAERLSVEGLEAINMRTGNGGVVSLAQLATLRFELEEPILWRSNKELLMTVRAGVIDGVQDPTSPPASTRRAGPGARRAAAGLSHRSRRRARRAP